MLMDRQQWNKGFTLIETLLVCSILSVLYLISVPYSKAVKNESVEFVINDIAYKQFEAIVYGERTSYGEYGTDISFNRKGGVNHADTYSINGIDIVVTLGTGRVYIDEKREYFD